MYGYILTYSKLKGRTFKLCIITRWDFNFCVRSSPLRGHNKDTYTIRRQIHPSISLSLSHTLSDLQKKKTNKSVVDSDSDIQCVMYRKQGNKVRRRANIPLNYAKRFLRALLLIFTSSPASPLHPLPVPHGTWRHEVHIPLLQFRPLFDVVTRRRRTHRLKWCHIASFHGARQHFQHSVMGIHYGVFFSSGKLSLYVIN